VTGIPTDPSTKSGAATKVARQAPKAAPTKPSASIGQARWAGALGAGVALGVGEIVTGFGSRNQSLVGSVGNSLIRASGGGVARTAISVLGTADKPSLVTGIVAVSLLAGALLGSAARRRPAIAVAGFCIFGLIGIFTSARDPLASVGLAVVAATLSVAAGLATLFGLLRVASTGHLLATPPPPPRSNRPRVQPPNAKSAKVLARPTDKAATRRAFFGWAGAAGAFAVTGALAGRELRGRSAVDAIRARIRLVRPTNRVVPPDAPAAFDAPGTASFPIQGLSPYIVPNGDFYRIDTALVVPQVDVAHWSVSMTGMVDHPFKLTFDDLQNMPQVEEAVTLSCVSNEVGGNLVGNAIWQGVPLRTLLKRAGVQKGASQIVGRSVDGFTVGFPTAALDDGRTALVAVGMNGEPLPTVHGFPARLVVAGLYGYVSACKWLTEIHLTTLDAFDAYWVPLGWSKEAPIKTQSRIDVPRSGANLHAGTTPIAGVAWAPDRGIKKVEVQVDDGPWMTAQLASVISKDTWCEWMVPWDAKPGSHRLRVRATDGNGQTQTSTESDPEPNGATGWHTRTVHVSA
jgi:DMSO/TMAO reductase YedYZ molybdopterin-dependent catalytic subunit